MTKNQFASLSFTLSLIVCIWFSCRPDDDHANQPNPEPNSPHPLTISFSNDTMTVSTDYVVMDYGYPCSDLTNESGYTVGWFPQIDACQMPPNDMPLGAKSVAAWCHFRILDSNKKCIQFATRVNCTSSAGHYAFVLFLQINNILENNPSSYGLGAASDFFSLDPYWFESGFKLEYGRTYTFQVVERPVKCIPAGYNGTEQPERLFAFAKITIPTP